MFEITKRFTIEAAHYLPRVPENHSCGNVHGHSYAIEIGVVGEVDDHGWVMDFGDIGEAFNPIRDALDHRLLNDVRGLENPTSEILSQWVYNSLLATVPALAWVKVYETATSSCLYRRR